MKSVFTYFFVFLFAFLTALTSSQIIGDVHPFTIKIMSPTDLSGAVCPADIAVDTASIGEDYLADQTCGSYTHPCRMFASGWDANHCNCLFSINVLYPKENEEGFHILTNLFVKVFDTIPADVAMRGTNYAIDHRILNILKNKYCFCGGEFDCEVKSLTLGKCPKGSMESALMDDQFQLSNNCLQTDWGRLADVSAPTTTCPEDIKYLSQGSLFFQRLRIDKSSNCPYFGNMIPFDHGSTDTGVCRDRVAITLNHETGHCGSSSFRTCLMRVRGLAISECGKCQKITIRVPVCAPELNCDKHVLELFVTLVGMPEGEDPSLVDNKFGLPIQGFNKLIEDSFEGFCWTHLSLADNTPVTLANSDTTETRWYFIPKRNTPSCAADYSLTAKVPFKFIGDRMMAEKDEAANLFQFHGPNGWDTAVEDCGKVCDAA